MICLRSNKQNLFKLSVVCLLWGVCDKSLCISLSSEFSVPMT